MGMNDIKKGASIGWKLVSSEDLKSRDLYISHQNPKYAPPQLGEPSVPLYIALRRSDNTSKNSW